MKLFPAEDRVYAECLECSWGCSGAESKVDDKIDIHECENPGHKVKVSYEEKE